MLVACVHFCLCIAVVRTAVLSPPTVITDHCIAIVKRRMNNFAFSSSIHYAMCYLMISLRPCLIFVGEKFHTFFCFTN